MNWVNCEGTWTNLDYLKFIYPAPISKTFNSKWIIKALDNQEEVLEFLLTEFNNENDAQNYLNNFMKGIYEKRP